MNITSKQKQEACLYGAIGLGVLMLVVYWFSFDLPPLMTLAYAVHPMSILGYVLSVPGLLFIGGIVFLLTIRNIETSRDNQRWLDAHVSNPSDGLPDIRSTAAERPIINVMLHNDEYVRLLEGVEATGVVAPDQARRIVPGDIVMARHEDDFGQMRRARIKTIDQVSGSLRIESA